MNSSIEQGESNVVDVLESFRWIEESVDGVNLMRRHEITMYIIIPVSKVTKIIESGNSDAKEVDKMLDHNGIVVRKSHP
ncbi:hypothetical protein Ahy_B04g072991 isoform A [Arachis hypogaea]|uniref:Uncharacterized protein n=1 Tax=Arachis hypogaea TaxID=3818 RepID=A0A444ZP78_ARAHY|nr:hypothetical protein Ahy_B04g072991 isoform A [Arachis hypogaea]